jgi:hypothetical protein
LSAKIADSNVITSKIADSNVTTAKIADDAVTLAKLENGTQGDVLYYGASGAPTRLSAGIAGQALVTNGAGSNPYWGAPTLVENIETQLDLTNGGLNNIKVWDITGIPSSAKVVTVSISNLSFDNTDELEMRVRTSAGVTTTLYEGAVQGGGGGAAWLDSVVFTRALANTENLSSMLTLTRMDAAGEVWLISGTANELSGGLSAYIINGTWSSAVSNALTGIRFYGSTVTGNFDAGTITVMAW